MAELFKSFGSETTATSIETRHEALAREIETGGCSWWWGMREQNSATGLERSFYDCGALHIAKLLLDQGAKVEESMQTAQSMRNVIADGFREMLGISQVVALKAVTQEPLPETGGG